MGYRLKPGQEEFTIVDGPLEGMNYKKGVEYPKAPQGYEDRFEYTGGGDQEDAESVNVSKLFARKPAITKPKESEAVKDIDAAGSTTAANKE